MKKILLSILCLFSIVAVHAEEVTVTFSELGYGNAEEVTTLELDNNVTVTFDKGTNSNTPKYYNTGTALRIYGGGTMTITVADGGKINSVTMTTGSGDYVINAGSSATAGTLAINGTTGTISGINSGTVTFTQGGSKGHVRILTMTIDYSAPETGATLEAPTASVEPGVFYNTTSVALSATDGVIHYTTDGTVPTAESPVYTGAIAIDQFGKTTTIKAIAIDGGEFSDVAIFAYTLKVATPVFSVEGGIYEGLNYKTGTGPLKLSTETVGAKVHYEYTVSGVLKALNSYTTSANVTINETTSVTATAFKVVGEDTIWSDSKKEYYTISPVIPHKLATSITSGKKYLINAGEIVADHLYESYSYGYLYVDSIEVSTNAASGFKYIKTHEFYGYTITETATAGEYTIQDAYGRYLYIKGTYTNFNVTDDIAEIGDAAVWTITFDGNNAIIANKEKGNIINYSISHNSYGAYTTTSDDYVLPTLFEADAYPTLDVTPAADSTVASFSELIVSCAGGLISNEDDILFPIYKWNTDFEYNYDDNMFNYGEQVNGTTYSFTPLDETVGTKTYRVTIPAGLFTLDPNGYNVPNEEMTISFNVKDLSILEITYATPDNGATVTSLQYLYFEFNQDITKNCTGAVITDGKGKSYPLTVSEIDAWGDAVGNNAICLKTAEPISELGTYTFVFDKDYAYAGTDTKLDKDVTYTFTLAEGLKITSITPEDGASVESISEITLTFNRSQAYPNGESFTLKSNNGNEYLFTIDNEAEISNKIRLITETPVTANGTYTIAFEEMAFLSYTASMDTEYSIAQTFTFTIGSAGILGDINNDGETDVADVTKLIAIILGSEESSPIADINNDGETDVADVTKLIAIILGNDTASAAPAKAAATRTGATSTIYAEIEDEMMYVCIANPSYDFMAYQFDLVLPEGIEIATNSRNGKYKIAIGSRADDHSVTFSNPEPNRYRVLSASLSNAYFYDKDGDIAEIELVVNGAADGTYEFHIENTTISGHPTKEVLDKYTGYITVSNGATTGIDSIVAEGENAATNGAIYDLQGRKVTETVKGGIYIKNGKKFIAE